MKTALLLVVVLTATAAEARGGGGHGGGHGGHNSTGRSSASTGEHWTVGHTTRTGTYVQGHYSTNPNGTRNDNYSTIGNVNPHTGEPGTKPGDADPK